LTPHECTMIGGGALHGSVNSVFHGSDDSHVGAIRRFDDEVCCSEVKCSTGDTLQTTEVAAPPDDGQWSVDQFCKEIRRTLIEQSVTFPEQ